MGEHRIETTVEIKASPETVWAVLTDFDSMPSWNPFMTSISGTLSVGARLVVRIVPPGKAGMTFKPTILAVHANRELRWLGHFLLPGLFDGEHYFLISPLDAKTTRLSQGEKFSGVLVGLLLGALSATEQGFVEMNAALKRKAEERDA